MNEIVVVVPDGFSGDVSGTEYGGSVFKFKARLGLRDMLRQDQVRCELLGARPQGQEPSDEAEGIAIMLAYVNVRLVQAPAFWVEKRNGEDLEDTNLLVHISSRLRDAIALDVAATQQKAKEARDRLKAAATELVKSNS